MLFKDVVVTEAEDEVVDVDAFACDADALFTVLGVVILLDCCGDGAVWPSSALLMMRFNDVWPTFRLGIVWPILLGNLSLFDGTNFSFCLLSFPLIFGVVILDKTAGGVLVTEGSLDRGDAVAADVAKPIIPLLSFAFSATSFHFLAGKVSSRSSTSWPSFPD